MTAHTRDGVAPSNTKTTRIVKSPLVATQDERDAVLTALLDMVLGSQDAKTESEALRMHVFGAKR
jgi:hypothetical protein